MPPKKEVQLTVFACHWCGKPLPKGRKDMKFHDVNCRMAHKRWKDHMVAANKAAKQAIDEIASYIDDPETMTLALNRLGALHKYLEKKWNVYSSQPIEARREI